MSFCHVERRATRVSRALSCSGAWLSWLIVLITTLPRVSVWVKDNGSRLGFTEGIQPEGMRLDGSQRLTLQQTNSP